MKVDAFDALIYIPGQVAFADLLDNLIVRNGACLVEFSEERVEIDLRLIVPNPLVPEVGRWDSSISAFEFSDDLWEVPWETQDVCMLLL
jgi:hypothetical protein